VPDGKTPSDLCLWAQSVAKLMTYILSRALFEETFVLQNTECYCL